jgi:cytochrome c556
MRFIAIKNSSGRRPVLLLGALLAIGIVGSAGATGLPQIVHARQAHFKALGRATKALRDQIRRSHPDWSLVASEASRIERLASALPSWFPAGSGKGHGVRTRARAAIWAHPREFARAARTLLNRAQNLTRAAASHDARALASNSRTLGQACGGCHRRFRARSSWW